VRRFVKNWGIRPHSAPSGVLEGVVTKFAIEMELIQQWKKKVLQIKPLQMYKQKKITER